MRTITVQIPDDVHAGHLFHAIAKTAHREGCKVEVERGVYRLTRQYRKERK